MLCISQGIRSNLLEWNGHTQTLCKYYYYSVLFFVANCNKNIMHKNKDNRNYPVMPMACLPNLCLVNKVHFIDQFCCSWRGWSCCFTSLHLKMNHENLLLQLVNLFICHSQDTSWHCNFFVPIGHSSGLWLDIRLPQGK